MRKRRLSSHDASRGAGLCAPADRRFGGQWPGHRGYPTALPNRPDPRADETLSTHGWRGRSRRAAGSLSWPSTRPRPAERESGRSWSGNAEYGPGLMATRTRHGRDCRITTALRNMRPEDAASGRSRTRVGVGRIDPCPHGGGAGNLRVPVTARSGMHPVVGKQAGFQSTLRGFGMRMTMPAGGAGRPRVVASLAPPVRHRTSTGAAAALRPDSAQRRDLQSRGFLSDTASLQGEAGIMRDESMQSERIACLTVDIALAFPTGERHRMAVGPK